MSEQQEQPEQPRPAGSHDGGEGVGSQNERQEESKTAADGNTVDDVKLDGSEKPTPGAGSSDVVSGNVAQTQTGVATPDSSSAVGPSNAALHSQILGIQSQSAPNSAPASVPSSPPHHASLIDDDELARLKSQISELTSQVTSLNGKLVQSYNRVGGLEDDIHGRSIEVKDLQSKVEKLEAERRTWEERYEGGLLVEKVQYCPSSL